MIERGVQAALRHSDPVQAKQLLESLLRSDYPDALAIGFRCLREKDPFSALRPDDDLERVRLRRAALPQRSLPEEVLDSLLGMAPPEWSADLVCMFADLSGPHGPRSLALLLRAFPEAAQALQRCLLLDAYDHQHRPGPARIALVRSVETCLRIENLKPSEEGLLAAVLIRSSDLNSPTSVKDAPDQIRLDQLSPHVLVSMQRLVRAARSRTLRRALVPLLDCDVLGDSALEALESARPPQLASILEESGHLLRLSHRHRHLIGSRVPTRLAGMLRKKTSLNPALLRNAPDLLVHCHEDQAVVANRLGVIGTSGDPMARHLARTILRTMPPSPERKQALLDIHRGQPPSSTPRLPVNGTPSLQQLESLLDTLPAWKAAACSLVHQIERPHALASMLRRTLGTGSDSATSTALEIVERRERAREFESELLQVAQSPSRSDVVRAHAVRLLAFGGSSNSARAILRSLADPSPAVQEAALEAATRSESSDSVELGNHLIDASLLERLARTSDAKMRRAALRALRDRDRPAFRTLLGSLFEGRSVRERLAAIDGARLSGEPELCSSVLRLLEDPASEVLRETGRIALRSLRASRAGVPSS